MNKLSLLSSFLIVGILSTSKAYASVIFSDSFHGANGLKLSEYSPNWSPRNDEPGTFRWGEYKIDSNTAGDGDGQIYNVDRLNIKLPTNFLVSEKFLFKQTVSSDPNLSFMDIRVSNSTESEELVFRFSVNQPSSGIIVSIYGPVDKFNTVYSGVGNYNISTENINSIQFKNGMFTAYVNGVESISIPNLSNFIPDHIVIEQSRYVSTASLTNLTIDDLSITSTPTPTPTPSPSPTTTPQPLPTKITMFSQRDSLWKNNIYDNAIKWSTVAPTIERWGCALTSASTILDYYGIKKLPGGIENNPGNLNTWLRSQPDGYIREGSLNWNAISRLSKIMSTQTIPALEYKYLGNFPDLLKSKLTNSEPVILEEPGHFVTAYQYHENKNITDIVDPYWTTGSSAKKTLDSYSNTFISMRTFNPSHTDLGYIMSVSDTEISTLLYKNVAGNWVLVSDQNNYIQYPLFAANSSVTSGKPFRILEYAKPELSEYQIRLTRANPGIGKAEIYTYDQSGNPILQSINAIFGTKSLDFNISYESGHSFISQIMNLSILRSEVITGKLLGLFYDHTTSDDLLAALNLNDTKRGIQLFETLINQNHRRIDEDFRKILKHDAKRVFTLYTGQHNR